MTDYAIFANARVYAHARTGELAAKPGTAVADVLRRMAPGEHVIPLYESTPAHGEDELRGLEELADRLLNLSGNELLEAYEGVAGQVPHVLRVTGAASERTDDSQEVVTVPVETEPLAEALPAADFLRLRALSDTVASQPGSAEVVGVP